MSKYIFERKLFLGFVSKVTTNIITAHIPSSKHINKFFDNGEEYHGGLVNSYTVLEGENFGFVCKIISIEIPEKERLEISTEALKNNDFHPLLRMEIQSVIDYREFKFYKSYNDLPNIGAKVYIAREEVVKKFLEQIEVKKFNIKTNEFAQVLTSNHTNIDFSLQNLFSRHSAIIGSTGSGKSWTTAKLIESMIENNQKTILLDATGEYENLADFHNTKTEKINMSITHYIDYKKLTFEDILYLVKPSAGAQLPKLKNAIKSLKLIKYCEAELIEEDYLEIDPNNIKSLTKKSKPKKCLKELENRYFNNITNDNLDFDIRALPKQIENECIWDGPANSDNFGLVDNNSLGFCSTLITRINIMLNNIELTKTFNFNENHDGVDFMKVFENFLTDDKKLLYINLQSIPFSFDLREIVGDIIAKKTLTKGRAGSFKAKPCLLILDEAHQFINKSITNDFDIFKLDGFNSIAKEGRKYGLFLSITTQLPRDLPVTILSQIGTFVIHRLINHRDKEIILDSLPSANKNILEILPELGEGEVILSSINLKQPLMLKINEPINCPDSKTPIFN